MPTITVSKGITRFEFENRKGYMVRICRKGRRISEYYSDSRFGGKRKALKAAQDRYNELYEKYGPPPKPTLNKLTARNSTGVVGVHEATSTDKRWPNCISHAYCATWKREDGSLGKVSFAWNKFGKEMAWELACVARAMRSTDREAVMKKHERQRGKLPKMKTTKSAKAVKTTKKAAGAAKKKVVAKHK